MPSFLNENNCNACLSGLMVIVSLLELTGTEVNKLKDIYQKHIAGITRFFIKIK